MYKVRRTMYQRVSGNRYTRTWKIDFRETTTGDGGIFFVSAPKKAAGAVRCATRTVLEIARQLDSAENIFLHPLVTWQPGYLIVACALSTVCPRFLFFCSLFIVN